MEGLAQSKFVRFAPRKVNQVLGLIRNKPVDKAFDILSFTSKTVTSVIIKTLKSAVANSGQLKNLSGIKVKQAWVGQGPTLKRMRPGPMGRGMPYKRKMCHVTIVVTELSPEEIRNRNKKKQAKTEKAATAGQKAAV
jgi:large subunit ribosomal protein L22